MRIATLLVLPLLSVACVPVTGTGTGAGAVSIPPGEVRIVSASATPNRLTVQMSNRTTCISDRPESERGGWSGVTSDCGYALPFSVTFQQGGSPDRFLIEDPAGIPGDGAGGLGPRAEIFVTDVDGRSRLFVSPLGANVRFGTPES